MPTNAQRDGGAYGETPGAPHVYHPQAAPAPAYDEYADPAAAHGWQNAYDETRELPTIPAGPQPADPSAHSYEDAPAGVPSQSRAAARLARQGRAASRRRRTVMAAGAAGVASLAAVIAGFAFSGVSSGDQHGRAERTGPGVRDSGTPGREESPAAPSATGSPSSAAPAASASVRSAAPAGASTAARGTPTARATGGATAGPSSEATAAARSSGPVVRPGHGRGNGKHPKWAD
ncbi:hypothetical protein [Streptomyces brasiliensis]|uniref:hypothetical protein n=1 Tax=Streptomyces brasiliensis TaxID=1954 RepID=UPI001670462F|nr:hypothetical protein [Streptomyces brasiliensis]